MTSHSIQDLKKKEQATSIILSGRLCWTSMKKDQYCVVLQKENEPNAEIFHFLTLSKGERDSWVAALLSHGARKAGKDKLFQ
jgi:hypothetical protein